MKKRIFVCSFIFLTCLSYFTIPDTAFGQSAQGVLDDYRETFRHPDVHKFFPDILRFFKDPDIQEVLNPIVIENFANNPRFIQSVMPNVDSSIIVLLTIDAEFQALFRDEDFHRVFQNPPHIEELATLIEGLEPRPPEGCEIPERDTPRPTTLAIYSGFGQMGAPGSRLPMLFIVEVRDQYGEPLPGVAVNFRVTAGGGHLSRITARTNNLGRASTTLTLGSEAGQNQVVASVSGIPLAQTFTATVIAPDALLKPTTLARVSGNDQIGQSETILKDKFIVEVRDQYGDALPRVSVDFRVTAGGGSFLLATAPPKITTITVRTDTNGQASVTFVLGSGKEENRVEARVVGVSQIQTFTATTIDADVNRDGIVNITDLSIVLALIGQPDRSIDGVDADINDDGIVNYEDLSLIFSVLEWAAAAPSVHALVQSGISAEDLRVLLIQAKTLPETTRANPIYQRSIVMLERLLAILTEVVAAPKQSALLVNYPNPFNPETWIPYQLSEASDVTVDIYAVDGRLIRTLALGYRTAGLYQRKSRAAYWDGRNELGEPVATGLYFYTLTAGDFTATRKMLIRK